MFATFYKLNYVRFPLCDGGYAKAVRATRVSSCEIATLPVRLPSPRVCGTVCLLWVRLSLVCVAKFNFNLIGYWYSAAPSRMQPRIASRRVASLWLMLLRLGDFLWHLGDCRMGDWILERQPRGWGGCSWGLLVKPNRIYNGTAHSLSKCWHLFASSKLEKRNEMYTECGQNVF